jgi:hypothetical protein
MAQKAIEFPARFSLVSEGGDLFASGIGHAAALE